MTKTFTAALLLLATPAISLAAGTPARPIENTWDYSVQVSAVVELAPAKVTLTWPQDMNGIPSSYSVSRRTHSGADWSTGTVLPGKTTSFVDSDVKAGRAYEYRIVKVMPAYTAYGYISAGVRAPLVDRRGKLALIVDDRFSRSLAPELERLEQDLTGDGWTVVRRDVSRNASVPAVKAVIKAVYDADPANMKSVFLFGHIPVPYSGQLNPDGHPDHVGAWPADAYYGDMDGEWTDESVNYTQTLNSDAVDAKRMSNYPGDGKFDQTILPSAVELQIGRVDLANFPGRTCWDGPATLPSETELLRNYLNKNHAFRQRHTNPPRRAVLGDYFGRRGGEAFAASGFRNFAPLVGADQIRNLNIEFNDKHGIWIPHVAENDYLLTYGCGAGSYSTIAGLGSTGLYNDGATAEFVQHNVRGVFHLLFGSWLGDWDHEDSMLRAPLATSHGLVSVWSGRPHWFMHALGTGETVGFTARETMNNTGDYQTQINSAQNRIHIALMGDPSLRLHPVAPVRKLEGSIDGSRVALAWTAPADSAIIGYHVYRAGAAGEGFTRLTQSLLTATEFADTNGTASAVYMVRAIKLENTTSGSYENPAQGVFWSATPRDAAATAPVATTTLPPDEAARGGSASRAALTIASSSPSTSERNKVPSGGTGPADRNETAGRHETAQRAAQ